MSYLIIARKCKLNGGFIMSEKQSCQVGTLGLFEHEISLIKNIFRLGNNRDHNPYELINSNLEKAHILIVSVDNEAAMEEWPKYASQPNPPILLVATPKELGKFPGYSFARPFSPAKILGVLDEIFKVELSHLFNAQVFKGGEVAIQNRITENSTTPQSKHRALVVDDSLMVRSQISRELLTYNLQADVAETGEDGLDKIETTRYDIIFLDVVLPGIDGYQVCKNIRRNPESKNIPIVMLTSKSSPFDKVRGSMSGCSAYLTKPVDLEKFQQVLEKYILKAANK